MRISNLPTVWTNVLAGAALAALEIRYEGPVLTLPVLAAAVALSLMYLGGMILNDLFDLNRDRLENPSRPLPSGRITPRSAAIVATLFFVAAVGLLWPVNLPLAGLLLLTIVLYNALHHLHKVTVLLMGATRALAYLIAAEAMRRAIPADFPPLSDNSFVPGAAAVAFAYTCFFSLVARRESDPNPGRFPVLWLNLFGVAIACAAAAHLLLNRPWDFKAIVLLASIAFAAWIIFANRPLAEQPPRVKASVMRWIAGFCVLDAMLLAVADRPGLALIAVGLLLWVRKAHRKIPGT